MTKKKRYIIITILIIWIIFFITDFSLSKINKLPVFSIPVKIYKDGGSTEYYGLGYKVIKYVNLSVEEGPIVDKIDFGTWFMKFKPAQSARGNNAEEEGSLWDRIPMVMVNGELYLDTGQESNIDSRNDVMDGEISSTVDGTEMPTQDNQSNFGDGYGYQYVDKNNIDIYLNGKWIQFQKESKEKEDHLDIIIQSPMTISNNDLFNINGESLYIRLRMVKGKYYEDWNPGAYMGTLWEGNYIIELVDEFNNTISSNDLSEIYNEPLIFNSTFKLQFDDYNNDGNLDFTIGQYASSDGNNFRLFTLKKNDGKIEELSIKGRSSLFISDMIGYYSTKLTKIDNVTFKIVYYDKLTGENVEEVFKWNGKEFVQEEN